jgi:hypothetical protein
MLILKTTLTRGQWGGIAIVIVALAMVGASSALRTKYSPGGGDPSTDGATSGQALAGIILILLGSLFNSIQGARARGNQETNSKFSPKHACDLKHFQGNHIS